MQLSYSKHDREFIKTLNHEKVIFTPTQRIPKEDHQIHRSDNSNVPSYNVLLVHLYLNSAGHRAHKADDL